MVKIAAPARQRKGAPPAEEVASVNLTKISDTDLVAINFKVPAAFRKTFKQYAAELGVPMTDLLIKAVEEFRKRN
ncbi:MAG: hypothetical protein SFU99_03190 [Saprospiraceae bacterium]|nr:hypothetical protein [Saprospiraceae bacterium]